MPEDDAYGRVTNPQRYALLVTSVRELIADLARRFDITVETITPNSQQIKHGVTDAVRLSPATGGGAQVAVLFTDLPGLVVRFGDATEELFPHCGCDACDEQPDDLFDDVRDKLLSVAAGGFEQTKRGYAFKFTDGGGESSESTGRAKQARRTYGPWSLRASSE